MNLIEQESETRPQGSIRPGTLVGERFRILSLLGCGSYGQVFLAEQVVVQRLVALKLLPFLACKNQRDIERFKREAQQTCLLHHPNTVICHDFGEDRRHAVFFLAMEYLKGESLRSLMFREGALPPKRVLRLLKQIAGSLKEAHGLGIIHRDLKPSNIMLINRGEDKDVIKVIDFGISKRFGEAGAPIENSLTTQGILLGTPHYMTPEQILDGEIGAASDLYSLGIIAFEMLTGHRPFAGKNAAEVIKAHVYEEVPSLIYFLPGETRLAIFDFAIQRALAKSPDQRFSSPALFVQALEEAWRKSEGKTQRMTSGTHRAILRELKGRADYVVHEIPNLNRTLKVKNPMIFADSTTHREAPCAPRIGDKALSGTLIAKAVKEAKARLRREEETQAIPFPPPRHLPYQRALIGGVALLTLFLSLWQWGA